MQGLTVLFPHFFSSPVGELTSSSSEESSSSTRREFMQMLVLLVVPSGWQLEVQSWFALWHGQECLPLSHKQAHTSRSKEFIQTWTSSPFYIASFQIIKCETPIHNGSDSTSKFVSCCSHETLHLVTSYMMRISIQNKKVNKPLRLRGTEWKSPFIKLFFFQTL